jgi:hypothetical protein
MNLLSIMVFCPYCKLAGRVRFVPIDGESDKSEIVKCPSCNQLSDAVAWIESADTLNGRRLRRPTQVRFQPNG